jgi:hypothetical protein
MRGRDPPHQHQVTALLSRGRDCTRDRRDVRGRRGWDPPLPLPLQAPLGRGCQRGPSPPHRPRLDPLLGAAGSAGCRACPHLQAPASVPLLIGTGSSCPPPAPPPRRPTPVNAWSPGRDRPHGPGSPQPANAIQQGGLRGGTASRQGWPGPDRTARPASPRPPPERDRQRAVVPILIDTGSSCPPPAPPTPEADTHDLVTRMRPAARPRLAPARTCN